MIELVAVVSMIIDHVGFVFFPEMDNLPNYWKIIISFIRLFNCIRL